MRNYLFRKKRYRYLAASIDAVGGLGARFLRRTRGRPAASPQNILLVRLDHLGDVLPATGIPKILKEYFPKVRVTFLTSRLGAPLLDNNPFVDEVLLYDAPWFARRRPARQKRGFFQTAMDLRRRRFDMALSLRGDAREHALLALAGVKERLGYNLTGGGFLLTRELPYRAEAHKSEQTLDILRALGIQADRLEAKVYFSSGEAQGLDQRLQEWGIQRDGSYVALQAGAGTPAKEWPVSHTRAFLRLFGLAFPGWKLVLVGEATKAGGIPPAAEQSFLLDLRGKTSLRELCHLLTRFRAFVGFDSGPAHLAAALDVPTVFLYSGTNRFEQWRPLQTNVAVLRHPVPCSPCDRTVCPFPDHPCMAGISPESVVESLAPLLSRPVPKREES